MSNTIKAKVRTADATAPTAGQLQVGELAFNAYDGKLYSKKQDGTVVLLSGGGTPDWASPGAIGSTTPNTGAFTTLSASGGGTFGTGSGACVIDSTGAIVLGGDTNLYRSAANTLKTDDALTVTGALICNATISVTGGAIAVYGYSSSNNSSVIFLRSDSATYIYNDGTNVYHRVGNNDTLVVSSTGVGINNSSIAAPLHVGTGGAVAGLTALNAILSTDTASGSNLIMRKSATSTGGPNLTFVKSNGTSNSPTTVASGDYLGAFLFYGYDGTNYIQGAGIHAEVSSTPGTNDMPSSLVFRTTADGASTMTERMRINHAGSVRFNSYGAGTLVTDASGNITASSDGRMKNVLGSFDRGLAAVCGLEPRLFQWRKDSGLNAEQINAGFIAQEVLPFIPEAISEKGGMYSMSDRPIIAALVNAIKELKAELDALKHA